MAVNLNAWMANETIQSKALSQIVFPGTHDSGTYGLTSSLSTIKYSNIAFLWQLSSETAPANGLWPWESPGNDAPATYYLGQNLYSYIFSVIQQQSQSQDASDTVLNQLNNGIRFFDLRVYFDNTTTPNDYYIQHGLRGPSLQTILTDVATFISNGQGTSKELIFLQLSHSNFDSTTTPGVVGMLQQTLGSAIYQVPSDTDLATFFANTILSSISGSGSQVIILNGDAQDVSYGSPLVFEGTFNGTNSPSGVDSVSDLEARELGGLQTQPNNPSSPWSISWALTPQMQDIISYIFQTQIIGIGTPTGAEAPLEQLAQQANPALVDFINNQVVPNKYPFNVITCDWYQQGGSDGIGPVVDIAISLSSN